MRRANRLETTSADFETRERKYLDRVYGKMAAKGYPNPKGKLLKTYRCPKCADNQPPFLKKYELITQGLSPFS